MSAKTIKEAIKANLDDLVEDEVLAGASISDLKKDPLAADTPAYPWAYLMPPSIESEALDNRTNLRTYNFDIMILWNAANLSDASEVETALETVLNKFDNDPDLSGTALGGVLPVSAAPQPLQHGTKHLIMGVVQIQAKQHVSLAFQ